MSAETTPAVQRLAEKQFRDYDSEYSTDGMTVADFHHAARADLTVALTDPDDPDLLARTLFVLHHSSVQSMTANEASRVWSDRIGIEPRRKQWRAVADGLRTALIGADS